MKNILQAAAMIILTALVILAAANLHDHVHDKCSKEWTAIPAPHNGLTKN
ncbi:MAG TPA: hypothetical protein VEB42_07465 [Chitinophagaceae bacterium]|nr:hypothetical protein [Chitinophagaceae bacterium]